MITLDQIHHIAQMAKESCETVMFACFSQPGWKVFFDAYLEHFFLPVIGIGLLMRACHSIYKLATKPDKTSQDYFALVLNIISSLTVAAAIALKLALLPVVFGPHLFLMGVAMSMLNSVGNIGFTIKQLMHTDNQIERRKLFSALAKESLAILTKAAVFAAVLATFVTPIGPLFVLVSSALASVLIGIQLIHGLVDTVRARKNNDTKSHVQHEGASPASQSNLRFFKRPADNDEYPAEPPYSTKFVSENAMG